MPATRVRVWPTWAVPLVEAAVVVEIVPAATVEVAAEVEVALL